ncbi:MAG: NAD-dependent epimerase/dehydratase family protein [Rickettsiales bacterium]|nr:MAG: NAD-dependent epimerase/dehydratase family protein [Rickettsiales bacterium]
MKFLIYGHNGWIGKQIVLILQHRYDVIFGEVRLDDDDNLEKEILRVSPDRIISVTGRTYGEGVQTIDYLEKPGKLVDNIRDNLYGPLNIAIICQKLNIHLTYLGTGCIFSDTESETLFKENDKPNFFGSSYSIVKGHTDRLMRKFEREVLNVRIRMPITEAINPRNFITKIVNYEKICSIPNSMTVLPDLLPIMVDMSKRKLTGTINLTNPGVISHNEVLQMYKDIVDPNFTWKNFTIEEQDKILAAKRSNNALDTSKLEALYPHVKPIKEAVQECLIKMKEVKTDYEFNVVLLTGGCGFIGSNTLTYLANKYNTKHFINLDKLDYCSREESVRITDKSKYTFYKGNLNDTKLVSSIFEKHNVDTVIHFAAQTHVDNSFGNSVHFTEDNVMGTHNLLECVRAYGKIKRFIHISTDEVYGEVSDDHLGCNEETSLLNPTNPYAATKASAEFIARSYAHSFKLPIIITRGNNVYGPHQYPEKLIPRFILLLLDNQKCTIHGQGTSKRNFIHVEDTATAIEAILKKGSIGEIYNIGTRNEYNVKQIAELLINALKPDGKYEDWITFTKDRNFNDHRYNVNAHKLLKLGWNEKVKFQDGLKATIEWYTNNRKFFGDQAHIQP